MERMLRVYTVKFLGPGFSSIIDVDVVVILKRTEIGALMYTYNVSHKVSPVLMLLILITLNMSETVIHWYFDN